jgi:hypothetical protein
VSPLKAIESVLLLPAQSRYKLLKVKAPLSLGMLERSRERSTPFKTSPAIPLGDVWVSTGKGIPRETVALGTLTPKNPAWVGPKPQLPPSILAGAAQFNSPLKSIFSVGLHFPALRAA